MIISKFKSFPNLIEEVNFNYIKLILIFLLLKTSPCFATNNLIININDTKIILQGNFVQGGLVKGKINKDIDIKFKEKVLRKTSDGNFVIGFGRDHPKEANLYFFINHNWILKKLNIKSISLSKLLTSLITLFSFLILSQKDLGGDTIFFSRPLIT